MVKVTVADPQNHGEGRSMHTTYRVDAVGVKIGNTSVRRRYSDFQWLYGRLLTESPGAFVPIIPHRRALSTEARISDELIKERKENLEVFLQSVVTHPELENTPSLGAFLKVEYGEEFESAKKQLEKASPNSGEHSNHDAEVSETSSLTSSDPNAVGKIRNLFAKASVAVSVYGGGTELERTEDENEIEEVQQYVDGLDSHTKALVTQATLLVQSTTGTATGLRVIGQSAFAWAQTHQQRYCPGGTDATVNTLGKISSASSDVSTLANQQAELETTKFENSLKDLSRMVQSIKVALQKRRDWSLTYTTRLKQISSRQASLGKLQKAGKINKVPQAQLDLATAEREAHTARKILDEVSQRVLREMDRVQDDLDLLFTRTMKEYADIQIQYSQKIHDTWSNLLPHLTGGGALTATTTPASPTAPQQEMFSMLTPIPAANPDEKTDEQAEHEEEDMLL